MNNAISHTEMNGIECREKCSEIFYFEFQVTVASCWGCILLPDKFPSVLGLTSKHFSLVIFVTKKTKRVGSLISAGIEPATLTVLTLCDNPYTTKPEDENLRNFIIFK